MVRDFSRHYGLEFKDDALLKLALTHRSYLSMTGGGASQSNERLEFLGDSVLGLVTSEHLFRTRPSEHEGQLTKTKSLLVSKAILSRRALAMGLGRFVLMSHSEIDSGGRQRLSILADAFESVIGAVYLDLGFEAAAGFIDRWLLKDAPEIVADKRHVNYKSHLQEYVQSTLRTHPVYRIRSEMGPDHSKHFMVEVVAGRRVLGEGRGKNKKEAEQAAARHALDRVTETRGSQAPGREGRERDRQEPRDRGRHEPQDRGRDEPQDRERHEPRDRERPETRERHEPRDRERPETRERHEPREPREREASPGSFVEPRASEETPSERAVGIEGEDARRGRRRGRRGGRGRRRPEGESTAGAESRAMGAQEVRGEPGAAGPIAAAGPPKAAVPMRRPAREARSERPREIEPLPPARLEDEIEEVGRPEGPPGERFVDPFAFGATQAAAGREQAARAPSAPDDTGARGERTAAGAEAVIERRSRREPARPESESEHGEGDEASEAGGRAGANRGESSGYGRRPGRGRRGPS